mgnify:CR=1 FL=1
MTKFVRRFLAALFLWSVLTGSIPAEQFSGPWYRGDYGD